MASNAPASGAEPPGSRGSPASAASPGSPGSPARAASPRRAKRMKPHPMRPKRVIDQQERRRKHDKRKGPIDSPGVESADKSPEVVRSGDVCSSPGASPGLLKPTNAARSPPNLVFVLVILLTTGLLFACLSILLGWLKHSSNVIICSSPACIMHAKELKSAMNVAVKPCANFYNFACGSWKPTGKERSMVERIYAHSRDIAIRELEGDPTESPVPLAPQYFQSCMANRSEELLTDEIEKFKSFKRGLGLKWPEEWPDTGQLAVAPLRIVLNLTVNWNINLLIKVRAMPAYRSRHKSLYISRGDWYKELDRTDEQFAALVKEHCDYLGVLPPDGFLEVKAHLKAITSATLKFTPDAREEEKRTLKDIEQLTSRRARWRQYLNEVYSPQFTWSLDDVVLIQHPSIVANLNHLLEKMPEASFRMAFSWVFVRMYLWIVIGKPELRMKSDSSTLLAFKKQTCLSHVESTFGLVASARHVYERFSKQMRVHFSDFFDMLREHIKISIASTSWIDGVVKKKCSDKLDGMWESVLPDNRFFSNYSLASLYKDFPEIGASFMDNVVNVAKAFRETVARDDYISIFSKRLGSGRVTSRYSYYYNRVSMDVGALEPPMLYADGTFAMMYGSLGTSLAAAMVRSFDERGILFNEKGEESPWWVSGHEEYEKRLKCDLGSAGPSPPDRSPSDTFTNPLSSLVPALGATFLAYRKAIKIGAKADVLVLQGLDTYSDDQVFFMTYCLMTCATDSNGDECNVPLRQSRIFATVFGCGAGDGMNPSEKCSFFD